MKLSWLCCLLGLGACASDPTEPFTPDAPAARCALDAPFGEATPVELEIGDDQGGARLSADERTVLFHRRVGPFDRLGAADFDLFMATRPSAETAFGPARRLLELQTTAAELYPTLSADGQVLYFQRDYQVWRARRTPDGVGFAIPEPVVITGTWDDSHRLMPYATERELLFVDRGAWGGAAERLASAPIAPDGTIGQGRILAELDDEQSWDIGPVGSLDGQRLWWSRHGETMTAARAPGGGWLRAEPAQELPAATGSRRPSWLSPDGCAFYLDDRSDGSLWVARRPAR